MWLWGIFYGLMNNCWNCKGAMPEKQIFCPTCKAICENYSGTYFELFSLPEKLIVNLDILELKYLEIQRLTHPDKYADKSLTEQMHAINFTALLNTAYETLQDVVKLAVYVLKNKGVDALPETGHKTPPELMMKSFEMHEALEDLKSLDALKAFKKKTEEEQKALVEALELDIQKDNLQQAQQKTVELKFFKPSLKN